MVDATERLLDTQRAFDAVASSYAKQTDANLVLRAMRERALATVARHVETGGRLLELGCGPGMDAEVLTRRGFRVTAIDWSPAMIAHAARRLARADRVGASTAVHLGIHELDGLAADGFDGAYSGLGALNCVPDLAAAAALIGRRLRVGAYLIASVMGPVSPGEWLMHGTRGEWRRAAARLTRETVPVPFNGGTVWTRYYTPRVFARVFRMAGFELASLRTLGLLAPPPSATTIIRRHRSLVGWLLRLEDRVASWPVVRQAGDHFLIVMVKRD